MRIARGVRSAAAGSCWCCCSRCSGADPRQCSRRRASRTSVGSDRAQPGPWCADGRPADSRRSCSARPRNLAKSCGEEAPLTTPPGVVLDAVQSACGTAQSAVDRYCPNDSQVYLGPSSRSSSSATGAPGDFARAYVIAHEIGHHVQNQLGWRKISAAQRTAARAEASALGPYGAAGRLSGRRLGSRANRERNWLDPATSRRVAAAAAIGDDTLQRSPEAPSARG